MKHDTYDVQVPKSASKTERQLALLRSLIWEIDLSLVSRAWDKTFDIYAHAPPV